jgi:hypothetical protein
MALLVERRDLRCPYTRARGYLAEALASAAESGNPETLRLRVTMLDLERDVVVHYSHGADPMHFDQPWAIRWTPAQAGPYPDFEGTLTVRSGEDYPISILELQGEYTPPFGQAGKVFDAVAGRRIASNTAQVLLKTIGDRMEERYNREEADKNV